MEIEDIVKKLVGDINPVGETHIDTERYENLKVMCALVDGLLIDIHSVAFNNEDSQEYSRKKAGEFADKFLTQRGLDDY